MYDIEKIVQAASVEQAIQALVDDPKALVICGGSDVLVQIREGRLAGCSLVSIQGIPELSGVSMEPDGTIVIGSGTTFSGVSESPIVRRHIPALGHAVDTAGGPQLRNIGTIGGNVCNGVTSADSASTLLTLNAQLEIQGAGGTRRQPLETFYAGPGKVHLAHDEILLSIRIAKQDYENYGGHYIKFAQRNAMDIATLGCAVHLRLSPEKTHIDDLRLAYGVAAPNPIRCHQAEQAVKGLPLAEETYQLLSKTALSEVNPRTSWRASKEFRQQLISELCVRALKQAAIQVGGAVTDENN